MFFSLKRLVTPTAFSFLTAVGGLLLLACVSTSQTSSAAVSFSPLKMTDGGRSSEDQGLLEKEIKAEFGATRALNSYMGLLGYNMEKKSKLPVVARWALLAPQELRSELVTGTVFGSEGLDIGYHRSRVSHRSSQIRLIMMAGDAAEILQNPISFVPDLPAVDGVDNDRDQKFIDEQLPQIERDLQALVAQIIQDHHYEARHLGGQPFARMDIVSQLGLSLSEAVNAKYFGLRSLTTETSRRWAHAWRENLDANLINDPRVLQAAQDVLKQAEAARHGMHTQLSGRELLRLVSREYETATAITQTTDLLLKNPEAFARARLAREEGRTAELDSLITEALRLRPVAPYQLFYVKDDILLHSGLALNKGQSVLVLNSVANRDKTVQKPTGQSHFAETDSEARLVQAEVRAAIGTLIALPGLQRVSGDRGQIDRRTSLETSVAPDSHEEFRYTFPEQMAVEWEISQPASGLQIASSDFAYEDYLNDYDRDDFRSCVTQNDTKELFFCRLEKNFRACLMKEAKLQNFFYLDSGDKERSAYARCELVNRLTPTEEAFYPAVMLGGAVDAKKLNTAQAQRTSGPAYRYEDYLKFYSRAGAVHALMLSSTSLLDARMSADFRACMGLAAGDLNRRYESCKNGVWNQKSLAREGALSDEERYFYETMRLARKENYKGP